MISSAMRSMEVALITSLMRDPASTDGNCEHCMEGQGDNMGLVCAVD